MEMVCLNIISDRSVYFSPPAGTVQQCYAYTLTGRVFILYFIPSSIMSIDFTPVLQNSRVLTPVKPPGGERKEWESNDEQLL